MLEFDPQDSIWRDHMWPNLYNIVIFEIIINLVSPRLFKMSNFNTKCIFLSRYEFMPNLTSICNYDEYWRISTSDFIVTFHNINLVRITNLSCLHNTVRRLLRKTCFSHQGSLRRHPGDGIYINHNGPPEKSVVHIYTFTIQS